MTSFSNAPAQQFGAWLGFFLLCFPLQVLFFFPTFDFFPSSGISHTCFVFICLPRRLFACQSLSLPLSSSIFISVFIQSSGPARTSLLFDPQRGFTLVKSSSVKAVLLCRDQLGVCVSLESFLLTLPACLSAPGLISAVYSCICTHTHAHMHPQNRSTSLSLSHTHKHTLSWTIC